MKISGSYASLLRGVSQQSPEVRQAGQHAEQVNFLSDPVQGLTRRRGTEKLAGKVLGHPIDAVKMLGAAHGYRMHTHISEGKEYDLLFRDAAYEPTYVTGSEAHSPAVVCYNRTDNVFVPLQTDAETISFDTYLGGYGLTAVTSVGKIIVMAVNGVRATYSTEDVWTTNANTKLVVWVRGGAYNRTYSIRLANGNVISYETPSASAAGAAEAVSPANIAAGLVGSAAAHDPPYDALAIGSHLYIGTAMEASASDGGDGTLMRVTYKTLDSVDKLPLMAWDGHVVKIETGPGVAFYVKAVAKTGVTGALEEVRWIETAGVEQGSTVTNFPVAVIEGGTLRMALSPALLAATAVPQIIKASAGDLLSNPAPTFMGGKQVTYLGVFQDRLLVASGAAVAVSAAGDYFNFWRSSVVTVPLKDGFEMITQGGEDDVIRHGVAYSRNHVMFGDKRQYLINGQQALTPTSANMSIMTTYADAAVVPPISAGGQVFYARNREGSVNIHQIQPGAYVDSAESFPASGPISTYIKGPAAQLIVVPGAPSHLLVRGRASPNDVTVFSYLDEPDGRKQAAWYKWAFDPLIGSLMGISTTPDGVLFFWLRNNVGLGRMDIIVDRLPMTTSVSAMPYLDSLRPWADVDGSEITTNEAGWQVAFAKPSERYLVGGDFGAVPDLLEEYPGEAADLWAGVPNLVYVDLTNPYIRDGQQLAVLTGRTVITKLVLNMRDSSGLATTLQSGGNTKYTRYNARVVGSPANLVGKVPVSSGLYSVPIGRETREYSIRLSGLLWYPLTIVGIEWTGQSYNRTPRA